MHDIDKSNRFAYPLYRHPADLLIFRSSFDSESDNSLSLYHQRRELQLLLCVWVELSIWFLDSWYSLVGVLELLTRFAHLTLDSQFDGIER